MDFLRTCALVARAGIELDWLRAAAAAADTSPQDVLAAPREALRPVRLPDAARAAIFSPDESALDADLRWLESSGATLVAYGSPHYPERLSQIPHAPAVLYVLGDAALLGEPQLAMVGSRHPTPIGQRTARDFAGAFARCGLGITSGLALGIDAASHEGALAVQGLTIAVCGHGLDVVYPREHVALASRISASGALVSEFPPGTPPRPSHFPQRNRILSGLALGTLVVEASLRSGSLQTARCAVEQGREVFAIPGSIHSPLSRGCHKLIREGAKLVETAEDVLVELRIPVRCALSETPKNAQQATARAGRALDKDYEMLLDALGFEPASIDALVERTGLPSESIASMLLILELDGHVQPHAGGRYFRLPDKPS